MDEKHGEAFQESGSAVGTLFGFTELSFDFLCILGLMVACVVMPAVVLKRRFLLLSRKGWGTRASNVES